MEHWRNLSLENISEKIDGVVVKEKWKYINGFDKLYQISNFGRVKSLVGYFKSIGVRILKQGFDKDGYVQVVFIKDGKRFTKRVHQLVAHSFIKKLNNRPLINHKKGIKTDNRASQLEWVNNSENVQHGYDVLGRKGKTNMKDRLGEDHPLSKTLNQKTVTGDVVATYNGTAEAARKTGFTRRGIGKACQGIRKSYKGFIWEYVK